VTEEKTEPFLEGIRRHHAGRAVSTLDGHGEPGLDGAPVEVQAPRRFLDIPV